MKNWKLLFLILLSTLVAAGAFVAFSRLKDRHPGYAVDLAIDNNTPGPLRAGFAAAPITPPVPDRWTDADNDAQYKPGSGDSYEDVNGNGRFDAVWLAGFQNRRPAAGVHDDLWARAMVLDDSTTRLAVVALDAIGFLADDVIDIRRRLPAELGIDYLIVASTHTHQAPDLLGLWGEGNFKTGVDPVYLEYVKMQARRAVERAVAQLQPARLRFGQDLTGAAGLVEDSRPPQVLDPGIRLLQAVDLETDTTLGVLFAWANHPETLWSRNLEITSDFPHFIRQAIEEGVYYGDSLAAAGLGGLAVYVNGAIGGLMTTSPSFGVRDPFRDTVYTEPSFDKARAQGDRLAQLGLAALRDSSVTEIDRAALRLRAVSVELPLYNRLYRLAALLGVIDRGTLGWMKIRSEVAAWRLGPATFLHQPGELYPEILNGGVEAPAGADFGIPPVEQPPLRNLMPGHYKFMVGLSNDMIGYIIPRSEWDSKEPWIYDYVEAPYGEINSVGPQTAPLLYQAMREALDALR